MRALVALSLVFGACSTGPATGTPVTGGPRDLDITVVAQSTMSGSEKADVLVAAEAQGHARLNDLVGTTLARPREGEVRFAIFQGQQPTGGYAVRVRGMRVSADTLTIDAEYASPAPDAVTIQVLTSPYVVVSVERTQLPPSPFTLVVRDQNGRERVRVPVLVR